MAEITLVKITQMTKRLSKIKLVIKFTDGSTRRYNNIKHVLIRYSTQGSQNKIRTKGTKIFLFRMGAKHGKNQVQGDLLCGLKHILEIIGGEAPTVPPKF